MTRWTMMPLATLLMLAACTSAPKDAGLSTISETVAQRTGDQPPPFDDEEALAAAQSRLDSLLDAPLTDASAVEIGILNNRALRADFYRLKKARGELIDAGRPPNPFLSGMVFDVSGQGSVDWSIGASFELLQFLFLPRIMDAAKADFTAAQAVMTGRLIDYAADVRTAFYQALAARQVADLFATAAQATAASAEAARALYDAGNIPQVDLSREELLAAETELAAVRARAAFEAQRENLNMVLGLSGAEAARWSLQGRLAEAPVDGIDYSNPDDKASRASLMLDAADARIIAEGARLGLREVESFIGDLELEFEREVEGDEVRLGGGLGVEIPIFNLGEGRREAVRAQLRAMMEQRVADEITLRAAARQAAIQLNASQRIATAQRDLVLPIANRVLEGSQLDFNAMQIGVFRLLDAKRDQLRAGRDYINALRDFWIAKIRFDQLIAGGSAEAMAMTNPIEGPGQDDRGAH